MALVEYFKDAVGLKKIEWKGNLFKFVLDEELPSFLFTKHKLRTIDVPQGLVAATLIQQMLRYGVKISDNHFVITFKSPPVFSIQAIGNSLDTLTERMIR